MDNEKFFSVRQTGPENSYKIIIGTKEISRKVVVIILVLVIATGLVIWWAVSNRRANVQTPVVTQSAQNQLRQKFTDQLPDLQKRAIEEPNNPVIAQQLGVAKYATGDLQGAKESYEKGVQLDNGNAVLHNNLGNTYRDLGDYAKAELEYRQAMKLDPKLTTPYMNLASIYQYVLGKPNTALEIYADGIEANPDFVDFYNASAAIYEQQGLKAEAIKSYEESLSIKSENPAAEAGLKRLQ